MEPTIELTPIQLEIVKAVTNGSSIALAVDRRDVDRPVVMSWCRTIPVFQAALEQAVRDRDSMNRERMLALSWVATTVLREIMEDQKASPSIRLRAAQTVLKEAAAIKKAESQAVAEPETNPKHENVHNSAQQPIRLAPDPGRNTLCPCGSGNKFKRCCANPVPTPVLSPALSTAA
jgi:uncharacterized protein YecA (UPF0149 family)